MRHHLDRLRSLAMASVVRLNGGPIDRILEGLGVSGVRLKLGRILVSPKARDDKTRPLSMKTPQKARKREMSKQAMREETERLVKEALEP